MARSLECLHWERRLEGIKNKKRCYRRCMVGKATLDKTVDHFNNEITIKCIHMHNVLANGIWKSKLVEFWDWCYCLIAKHEVNVLLGDFNMSLFRVIPELRQRNVVIDLAAWHPWQTSVGLMCADSCGIFFIAKPGVYSLIYGRQFLHKEVPCGLLMEWDAARRALEDWPYSFYHIHETNGGPGQSFATYLPRVTISKPSCALL